MAATDLNTAQPCRFTVRLPRPLWIGLGTLVLVIVAVGLRFGAPIYRQQRAVRLIERLGGIVEIEQRGPKWLHGWLGDERMEMFGTARKVFFVESEVTDADLVPLRALSEIDEMSLAHSQVSDCGLIRLSGLQKLERLSLADTFVRDEGMAYLKNLEKLSHLDLSSTFVSDDGLVHVGSVPSLVALDLSRQVVKTAGENYGRISDAGIKHLAGLKKLRSLNLRYTEVTSEGLRHLGGLSELKELDLSGTRVDEQGIQHLKSLGNLETLLVSETSTFTDRCLRHLIDIKPLKHVSVVFTSVTSNGVREFEKRRPDVRIDVR